MSEGRDLLSDTCAFTKSAGSGIWNAGAGMVEGIKGLAQGGYKLTTDEEVRAAAWKKTKELAEVARNYGEAVYYDPGKAYRDARDGTLAAIEKFEKAKDLAETENRLAEFYGEITGTGVFEIATVLVPVGIVTKAGRLGKVAGVADNVAEGVEKAEDVLGASQRAKGVLGKPVIIEHDAKSSPVARCPVGDDVANRGVKNTDKKQFDFNSTDTVKYTDFRESIEGLSDQDELADQAFQLFKKKKWEKLEELFEKNDINGGWPPNRGAISSVEVSLKKGKEIDRYGGFIDRDSGKFKDLGAFTSNTGEPFKNRALPIDTLDKPYKKYIVIKEVPNVQAGKAIPWFGQPGDGLQYELPLSIDELITNGYIKEIK